MWIFGMITNHMKMSDSYWKVKVMWYNGEETQYIMKTLKEYDKINLYDYAI